MAMNLHRWGCWVALLAVAAGVAGAAVPEQPNFVIIFIDDLGYADIGPFGATKQRTPHLDRMADEGLKLTSFYGAPVCSPSRAELMTGSYLARVSVPHVYFPGSPAGLNPDEVTIAERLKALGYATTCIGKWHLGDHPEFLPTRQGFDRYFGIPYSNDMQRKCSKTGRSVVPLLRDEAVEELLEDEDQRRIIERYTAEAVRFIRESASRPFFLYFPHTAVHTPIWPGEAFAGKSANGRFGDWVEELDWSVGRVLDTLRDLNLDRRTLVIFTSDNGPWLIKKSDGGSAGPLRGGKGSTWEGGVRVPTVAWWPGRIAAGAVCDAVAGTIDLLPTLVGLAGGAIPPEPVIDGRDISGLLFGTATESPREAHYYFAGYALQAVRQGPWKLAIAPQRETMGVETVGDDSKIVPRLYNLDDEIGERTNLADRHPDVVARLRKLADTMNAEIGGDAPSARRPAGKVENPVTLYPAEERALKGKKTTGKAAASVPARLDALKPGDVLQPDAAPRVEGRPFTVSVTVETARRDGVIMAHGGVTVGYAVHARDGCVVFSVRNGRDSVTEVVSQPVLPGVAWITASLAGDGAMSLAVNSLPVVSARAQGLLGRQPAEDFCVGHDNLKPVADYPDSRPFEGKIENLAVSPPAGGG